MCRDTDNGLIPASDSLLSLLSAPGSCACRSLSQLPWSSRASVLEQQYRSSHFPQQMIASSPSIFSGHWNPSFHTPWVSCQPWQYSPLAFTSMTTMRSAMITVTDIWNPPTRILDPVARGRTPAHRKRRRGAFSPRVWPGGSEAVVGIGEWSKKNKVGEEQTT